MSRVEFMEQLESLLDGIPQSEKEAALQYYQDYFEDAGPEKEQDVVEALGSPAKVAENIQHGMQGEGSVSKASVNDRAVAEYREEPVYTMEQPQKKGLPTWAIVLLVVLGVLAFPVIVGVAAGALGLLIGIFAVWGAVIFSVSVLALALFIVMIVLIAVGFLCAAVSPLVSIALIGGGLICGGIGILCLMLTALLAGIVTPAVFKGIAGLFGRKKKAV